MFYDRRDAGERLARALAIYRNEEALVLAVPRGGVEVGYEVATYLNADFSLLVTRKLPLPDNPETAFGAIAEDGSRYLFENVADWLPRETVAQIVRYEQEEIRRRIEVLRDGEPLPKIEDRVVILVDDGIAMGSTIRASIMLCQRQNADRVIVAVPVTGARIAQNMTRLVDEFYVLEQPPFFRAVAQVYRHWREVTDAEVLEIMDKWERERQVY